MHGGSGAEGAREGGKGRGRAAGVGWTRADHIRLAHKRMPALLPAGHCQTKGCGMGSMSTACGSIPWQDSP